RRDGGRLAEGADAAAGDQLQSALAQGAGGEPYCEAAEVVLGLGRNRDDEQDRLLAVHAEHQSALWPGGIDRDAARGRAAERVRATPAPCPRVPRSGAGGGAAGPV